MKYVILHGGGMADVPHPALGGKTPLQMAATPNMDLLARKGELGLAAAVAEGVPPGTAVGQLAFFGYDLHKHHCGPAPFEAVGQGVALGEHDVVFRCSMVTLRSNAPKGKASVADEIRKLTPQVVMEDASAGGIEEDEARELIDAINEQLGSETIQFYPGAAQRHLMVWVGGKPRAVCRDPREAAGRAIGELLPSGDGADFLRQIMEASLMILQGHAVNEQRRQAGRKAINCLWLWGSGKAPNLPKLTDQYRIAGSVVSGSDLIRGMGMCAGLDGVSVAGSDGSRGPDFSVLAQTALRELAKKDFVYVHGLVPSEAAGAADPKVKQQILEEFDRKTVGPILDGLAKLGDHRVILICDHAEPAARQQQVPPVPYVLYAGSGGKGAGLRGFNEADAHGAQTGIRDASRLMNRLFSQQTS